MRRTKAKLILSFVMITIISLSAVGIDPDLEDSQVSVNNHFRTYYTDCKPTNHPDKCVFDANISDLNNQTLEDLYNIYTNSAGDFQLKDPTGGKNEFPVQVTKLGPGGGGVSYGGSISLSSKWTFDNPISLKEIPLHELFHEVTWTYGDWGGFSSEGMAVMMQDKVYDNLDKTFDGFNTYWSRVESFLGEGHTNSLINQGYSACLFWTYLTEQFGTVKTEPQLGVDAVRLTLQQYGSGTDDLQRINTALNNIRPGTAFKDVFMDFIVANYAKDLSGSNVPGKYKYIDDDQLPGAYRKPSLALGRTMPAGDTVSATNEIRSWSAKYYEISPGTNVPIISLGFHQTEASSVNLVYDLLAIRNDDLVMDACEFNVQGKDFERTFLNKNYDRVVVVVGGLDYPSAFRYYFSTGGGASNLNILWPKTGNEAKIDLNDLNKFLVHLEVLDSKGVVLSGLKPGDFQVNVSGTGFDVVTGAEVMGQYWLVVQPKSLAAGTYDLQVSLAAGSITDIEAKAVEFAAILNSDNVLVIDRSGTMLQPNWNGPRWEKPEPTDKIYGAISAASLYVNSLRTGDKMGTVWFSNDATPNKALMDFNDANRLDLLNSLKTLDQDASDAWGATSMGDGLWKAQDELDNRGDKGHDWSIVLLSDGLENEKEWMKDVVCGNCKINMTSPAKRAVIHTVALGSNADREKLEKLAIDTQGKFEYVIEPHSGDVINDLADVYRIFAETVLREQRIAAIRGEYDSNSPVRNYTINMEKGATEAVFVVNSNTAAAAGGKKPTVTLRDPDGNVIPPKYEEENHILYSVALPKSGAWTVELMRSTSVSGEFSQPVAYGYYLIEVSVKSKATLEAFLGLPPEKRIIGAKMPVLAFLTDTEPLSGATIDVEITTPEVETGTLPSEIYVLHLYDDGVHGDGRANDGVYAGIFPTTGRTGIYDMKVKADGYSSLAGNFHRETKLAFNIRGDVDGDGDRLPDKWEEEHELDPNNGNDDQGSQGDPDGDGLNNLGEFEEGTNPQDPDTDDGGEGDGSEVQAGKDPNEPYDDQVLPPTSLRAAAGVNLVNLSIGYRPEHDLLVVHRSNNESGPWQSFEIAPVVKHTDSGLQNDFTYYYKVTGVDLDIGRRESAPTEVVSATPRGDPIPPSGQVEINNGNVHTKSQAVVLNIWADSDTKEMKVSNDPDMSQAAWEPFSATKLWTLLPGKGLRSVFVIFKDQSGNIGPRGSEHDPSVEIAPAIDTIILKEIPGVPGTSGEKKQWIMKGCD